MNERLKQIFQDRFKENEQMSKHTNFRIGGPAKYYVEVKTVEELQMALTLITDLPQTPSFARREVTRYCVLGGGSNVLFSDKGFDGLVIKICMREVTLNNNRVQAEAGTLMTLLSRKVGDACLSGLEWAITLPGTVGGAVRGNAGCFDGEIKDHFIEAQVLSDGKVVTRSKEEMQFRYRDSIIKHSFDIVLSAVFELSSGDCDEIKKKMEFNLTKRKISQPLDAGSAGCMFKNIEIKSDEEMQRLKTKLNIPLEMSQSRRVSAGWLIDQLDLKGMQIGGAKISDKHGNFLLNTGNATADDVMQLIAFIKTRARNTFGLQLEEEVQYI